MTNDQFFKRILEDELFKDINQCKAIEDFLLARTANFSVVNESADYRRLQETKQSFEAEFRGLYEDQETGERRVFEYIDLVEEMGAIADVLHFQKGFYEGAKFLLAMILFRRQQ